MLKLTSLLFNSLALIIYSLFFADVVTISQKIPAAVKPATEFTVELKINKGTASGFAKLQIDLPDGFTATEDKSNGSSFTFSNKSVKFIWMSMPSDKDMKVSYKLKADAGTSGDFQIGGKFSFISDNEKQVVDIKAGTIKITPDAPNEQVAVNTESEQTQQTTTPPTANKPVAKTTTSEANGISCVRNLPAETSTEFVVDLVVKKGKLTGFAKLIESLPKGFTASAIESAGAIFTYEEQRVKFVWMTLPTTPDVKISYKVKVSEGIAGSQVIDGSFSYIEDDETKKYVIPTSTINAGGAVAPPIVAETKTEQAPTEPIKEAPVEVKKEEEPVIVKKEDTKKEEKQLAATTVPSPQGKVNYSVQIAALQKAKTVDQLANIFKIDQPINTEMADGFTKYTVGSYSQYKQGRDAREEIKNKGVPNPWVTSYNNGKRITVQEALMISNQKWYR